MQREKKKVNRGNFTKQRIMPEVEVQILLQFIGLAFSVVIYNSWAMVNKTALRLRKYIYKLVQNFRGFVFASMDLASNQTICANHIRGDFMERSSSVEANEEPSDEFRMVQDITKTSEALYLSYEPINGRCK